MNSSINKIKKTKSLKKEKVARLNLAIKEDVEWGLYSN